MRVAPSQLVPGCILLMEVKGKSNRPIIVKNTVLTDKHIEILEKFLVESVEVSSKLSDGEEFSPKSSVHRNDEKIEFPPDVRKEKNELSFMANYKKAVTAFKKQYQKWQNSMPIDIPAIRKIMIPLLEQIETIPSAAIYALHEHGEKRDYIYYHCVAVSLTSAYLGKKMGYSKGEWLQIGLAGLLSDCGLARIDADILLKAGPLTESEYTAVKNHPTYSYRMVENLPTITPGVKLAVLQHHERVDGYGYPLGISKEKIHQYAKVVAVADMYHAMTSERLYRKKISPFKVIEEIQRERYLKFDSEIVDCFLASIDSLTLGAKVILSDNTSGEIVFINPAQPTRPMVRIAESDEIISLEQVPELYIEKISAS
ncbi:HD-GYP domain-containing protein [Oceanobacillus massiliensis]|uniref:HD-GYP domain-containing protein n=1 Tax=Oceanobacillus massiliensis TaxID=1465765 RepID=UPI00301936FE